LTLLFLQQPAYTQETIEDRVEDAIDNYYYGEFTVEGDGEGNVKIEGSVETLYDKYKVFDLASTVPGVRTITNNIVVNTPVLPDNIIENNIRDEMKLVSSIPEPDRISVEVTNGIVFLEGTTSSLWAKRNIVERFSGVLGVREIDSNLDVESIEY